jgi:hypothetical protein
MNTMSAPRLDLAVCTLFTLALLLVLPLHLLPSLLAGLLIYALVGACWCLGWDCRYARSRRRTSGLR